MQRSWVVTIVLCLAATVATWQSTHAADRAGHHPTQLASSAAHDSPQAAARQSRQAGSRRGQGM